MTTTHLTGDDPVAPHTGSDGAAGGLSGRMGTAGLLFTVLAYNGPIAVVIGYISVVIGYGNGIGAPSLFIVAPLIVATFAIGFATMASRMRQPGGFYSFVTAGLGRDMGLGMGFLAVFTYLTIMVANYAFIATAARELISGTFNGPTVSAALLAVVALALVGLFGYLKLELSARILTVLLIAELVVIFIYDAAVVAQGGSDGLSGNSFVLDNVFVGGWALGLLFATLVMSGFEATVIFREEVRDPDRTIPRAMFGFLASVAFIYALTTWALVQALGEENAVAETSADPVGATLGTMETFIGAFGRDAANVLLVTGMFAASLALHNVLTRYVYNLSVDQILPANLAKVHPSHKSPYRSSVLVSVVALLSVVVWALAGADPAVLYAQVSGVFGYALILAILITAFAVPVYLQRHAPEVAIFKRLIAPVTAVVLLAGVLVLATDKVDLLIPLEPWLVKSVLGLCYAMFVLGVLYARYLRAKKPDVYRRIGRQ